MPLLEATDSTILTLVLQADSVNIQQRLELLSKASPVGQKVGKYLLGISDTTDDIRKLADQFKADLEGSIKGRLPSKDLVPA